MQKYAIQTPGWQELIDEASSVQGTLLVGVTTLMEEKICQGIKERRLLSIYYDGDYRRIEPHIYGRSKTGKSMLRAYQVEGYSESGENYFWKMFDVSKIEQVNLLEERFLRPRPDYRQEDPVIVEIECQL